jgi:hypothetical protein
LGFAALTANLHFAEEIHFADPDAAMPRQNA